MKQKLSRALSLILIFALCLGLISACGGGEENTLPESGSSNPAEASPEPVSNEGKEMAYYVKTLLPEENTLGIIGKVCPADGGIYIDGQIMNHAVGTSKSSLYFMDKDGEIKSLNSDWIGESVITFMCAAEDSGLWLIKSTYISHDNNECELGSFKNGEYSKLLDLDEDDNMYIQGLCAAKGRLFISRADARGKSVIEVYKPNGEKDFEVNVGATFFSLVSDGTSLYIASWDISRALRVNLLNPENGDITELTSFERGNLLGCSDGKLYIGNSTELTEYDIASKSSRSIILWTTCGLNGYSTLVCWPDGNGGFILHEGFVIKNIYQDVKRERTQVIFAVNSNPHWFSKDVFKFNEENTEYEMIIKDYGTYPDPQQALNTDMISGKTPDLIDAAGFSGEIIKHGTMKDLMKYIEADSDFGVEDFLEGPLNAMKTKEGELLAIAPRFYVCTILCPTSTAKPGEYEGVVNELNKLGKPEEAFCGAFSRESFLSLAFCCGDADKYSREDVRAIIEFASHLMLEQEYYDAQLKNQISGTPRFECGGLSSMSGLFHSAIQIFGCKSVQDINLIGLPFREGSGVLIPRNYFAIPANAANADGAWAFLKSYILPYKNVDKDSLSCGTLFKNTYEIAKEESGKSNRKYYEQEYEIYKYKVTDEDIAYCSKLLDELFNNINGVLDNDAKVYEIVTDACGAYFAGQKSLDATADEIVSRLGIYFSEQS